MGELVYTMRKAAPILSIWVQDVSKTIQSPVWLAEGDWWGEAVHRDR
jgi:hypothetical protein